MSLRGASAFPPPADCKPQFVVRIFSDWFLSGRLVPSGRGLVTAVRRRIRVEVVAKVVCMQSRSTVVLCRVAGGVLSADRECHGDHPQTFPLKLPTPKDGIKYLRINIRHLHIVGVRVFTPTDKNLCRCFGAPACRVFPDHLIIFAAPSVFYSPLGGAHSAASGRR